MTPTTGALATRVRALADSRMPTLGSTRLVCVDGPAGSGKTTLAAAIGAPTVHVDDLLDGWEGLPVVGDRVLELLTPLAGDEPGHYRRFDWLLERYAEGHVVEPAPLLVLEGVGAGNRAWRHWSTVLVWMESDPVTRLDRGMRRDGEQMRARWEQWMRDEQVHFAREQTRTRADLVVPT